jgi:hypothetical protein
LTDETISESDWSARAMTERASFTFVVKEGSESQLSIAAEPLSKLRGLSGLIQLDFKDGTAMAETHELAKLLRQYIRSIAVTAFH